MTLRDLHVRFKVIDSLNATKMAKYSLVMIPTPCRAFVHLLNYTVGSGVYYKAGNISEMVENRAKVTINSL